MQVLLYIAAGCMLCYAILMAFFIAWWQKMPLFVPPVSAEPGLSVSVIVAARNEEATIGNCLRALLNQDYPAGLLEVIVVNDHSTDNTEKAVQAFSHPRLRLIRPGDDVSPAAPKKKAIAAGIAVASGELIVTTDADCTAGPEWIKTIVAWYRQSGHIFIAAPVAMSGNNSILSVFQSIDFLTMQGITAATAYRRLLNMCNGANLAYTKKVFDDAGGFAGIDAIASGDDMLLMHKIAKRFPGNTGFLKSREAIVTTQAENSWSGFLQQRVRWASKAVHYKEPAIFLVLLLVYLTNLFLLLAIGIAIVYPYLLLWPVALLGVKFLSEAFFVRRVAHFFGRQRLLPWLLLLQPLHILYIVISGLLGQVKTYSWKGRKLQ